MSPLSARLLATRCTTARKIPTYRITNPCKAEPFPGREFYVLATTGFAISFYGLFQGAINYNNRKAAKAAKLE